jgi:hypothetical protein
MRAALLVTAGLVAGVFGGSATASAARFSVATPACSHWVLARPPDPGAAIDTLFGVAVLSAKDVWAVGDYANASGGPFRTLIEHWNGRAWKAVSSPNPGIGSNSLSSVTAVGPDNIWVVGDYSTQSGGIIGNKTLILHWNGRTWSKVASPSPGSFDDAINTVHRVSAANIWAVGTYAGNDLRDKSLILHWNGRSWKQMPSPNPGMLSNSLSGLAIASASDIWANELYQSKESSSGTSQIVRWNGHAWRKAAAGPAGSDLIDITASSSANAWSVGDDADGRSLALHWNGRSWKRVPTPNLRPNKLDNALQSVTAVSGTSAWAVGVTQNAFSPFEGTAIELHWNGRKWSMMASPATGGANSALFGVQATPSVSPWAVGEDGQSDQVQRTLVLRCH